MTTNDQKLADQFEPFIDGAEGDTRYRRWVKRRRAAIARSRLDPPEDARIHAPHDWGRPYRLTWRLAAWLCVVAAVGLWAVFRFPGWLT